MSTRSIVALLAAAAILYLAREVLIPVALAILLAFLLAPAVRLGERLKLGRVASTLIVVVLGFSLIGAVGWVAGSQAVSLAAKLPEYRANVAKKLRVVRDPTEGTELGRAAEAIKDLEKQADPAPQKPVPVVQTPKSALGQLLELAAPVAKPVGGALAVLVLTILFLLHRENNRERLIGLIGPHRINATTRALSEASYRVSRYLLMQLMMNAAFGIPFGIALHLIGIPNALLWGLLATLLRFIPYAGVWIAVSMPLLLAFAIFDGWSEVLWVLGVFVALELVLVNFAEPLLYGKSAGLSPIAIIAAALFWTWLWGPIGLLLATPITVCIAVMGRYIPEMGYLNVLLGVEPVLEPETRFYQRLIAMDEEEAEDLAEKYANQHGLSALHQDVVIPALALAERDRHNNALDEERSRFVFDTTRHIVEYVEDRSATAEKDKPASNVVPRPVPPLAIVGAHDEADHVAGLALARLLPPPEFNPKVIGFPLLAAESLEQIIAQSCKTVCISAVPPNAAMHAAFLCKRLKQRLPDVRVLVALWTSENSDKAQERLRQAGVDQVATTLADAVARLRELQQYKPQAVPKHGQTTVSR